MDTPRLPVIAFAERLDNAVVVAFQDGRCARYSAALLDTHFSQADDLTDLPDPDQDTASL